MADTIVTNTPATNDSGAAGWVVAIIILIAVIVGGIVMYQRGYLGGASNTPSTTNVNVTVPNPAAPAPAATTP